MFDSLAPFVPSDLSVVKKMLEIARVGPDDVVFDLGCGDGRILITAVRDFGAKKAVGYEMRKEVYEEALTEISNLNLRDKITLINDNLLKADLSEATVITLYLTTSGNTRLRPKLEKETRKGTRIISHNFKITGWHPLNTLDLLGHSIYLYLTPDTPVKEARAKSPQSIITIIKEYPNDN